MMTVNRTGLKEVILDRCNELDIYSHYCGAKVVPGRTMKSPLREGDKNPSFNVFKTKDGRYMFKDFAGQSGDVFKFVMLMYKIDFSDACKRIAFDMKVDTNPMFERIAKVKSRSTLINIHKEEKKEKALASYKSGNRHELHIAGIQHFFSRNEINLQIISHEFHCFYPGEFSVGKYTWKFNEKTYDDFAIGIAYPSGNLRFYRPNAKLSTGPKHIGNSDSKDIFGMEYLNTLDKVEAIIICAGQKDTLVLQSHLFGSGIRKQIRCICLNSESCSLSIEDYMKLRSKTDKIYSIYDNDQTGMRYAQKLQDNFGVQSLTGLFSYSGAKDVADHCALSLSSRTSLLRDIVKTIDSNSAKHI